MSEFLGSRISLISKSDIRYAGTLHEINSEESTVSLENVRSFGTEGRRGRPDEEIAPSDQVYEYIVFRGSDVKDLRIEEHPTIKESKPPPGMPDDPAIVGARTRDGAPPPKQNISPSGSFQPPYPPQNLYPGPPPPGPWGRGLGPVPMPGPGFGNMPYPPPPGWFPPGQGFPPASQAPWANQPYPPPGRGGPPMPEPTQNQHPSIPSGAPQKPKTAPDHPAAERSTVAMPPTQPVSAPEPKSFAQAARQPAKAPSLPQESKPSVDEVRAVASTLNSSGAVSGVPNSGPKPTPTAPRNNRINPVLPLSGASAKPFQLPTAGKTGPTTVKPTAATAQTSIDDATNAARAAVALAMAQLGNSGGNAMDNLTKKVNEMRVNAHRGVATSRGRGRGGRPGTQKVDVPDSDFDFAQSNAKFNKEEIAKEATGGSPENYSDVAAETPNSDASEGNPAVAYNKSRSFFDNISSEARDRAENGGQKPGGREWRGEEQRKNMETFGQGSVDGGYRSNYRGRGRGRSTRSRGYGRGGRGVTRPQFPSTAAEH